MIFIFIVREYGSAVLRYENEFLRQFNENKDCYFSRAEVIIEKDGRVRNMTDQEKEENNRKKNNFLRRQVEMEKYCASRLIEDNYDWYLTYIADRGLEDTLTPCNNCNIFCKNFIECKGEKMYETF